MNALQTYRSFCGIKLAEMRGDLAERVSATCTVGIRVHSGLHAGSETMLTTRQFRIGGETDHDIMLVDEHAAGPEIRVECAPSYLGTVVRISSYRQDVKLNGKPVRSMTEVCLPAQLIFGDIEIELFDPQMSLKQGKRETLLFGGLAVASAAALGAFIWYVAGQPGDLKVSQISQPAQIIPDDRSREMTIDAASVLETMVGETELAGYLDIKNEGEGSIGVSGTLPSSQVGLWNDLRAEYDRLGHDAHVISSVSVSRGLSGLPAIALVRLSGEPQLVLTRGERLRAGDPLIDGWIIEEITSTGLLLSRRGELMTVAY